MIRSLLLILAVLPLTAPTAWADQVTLAAVQDASLYSEDPNVANAAGVYLFTGRTDAGDLRRALIRFDVAAAIPPLSVVNSVSLSLRVSRTKAGNESVGLHRVTDNDWGEGTSAPGGQEGGGTSATDNDATWLYTFYDTAAPSSSPAWNNSGGDFSATASATATVGGNGFYAWGSTPGMLADVQAWVDATLPNHGWMVVGNEAVNKTAKRFDSRQNGTPANRPELTVDFTPPPDTGACCAADGSCTIVGDPGGTCSGTYQGLDTVCSPNPCPPPVGACCLPVAAATCTELIETDCTTQSGTWHGALTACVATECPVVLTPFVDALPLPAVAQPITGAPSAAGHYEIAMRELQQTLHAELPPTTVWGYDAGAGPSYPGPTIEARKDQLVTINWTNDLRDTSDPNAPLRTSHYLAVDTCPHGADDAVPRTVVHLHGGHVAPDSDGYPEETFEPGQSTQSVYGHIYEYPNGQLPATLWYHDHALGITRLNVYMGLAAFYLLRDSVEEALSLPAGEFEIPLAIQDRTFAPDGSLSYPAVWQDVFFGDKILVNGKVWPFLNVKQGKYRLRLLNGSTSRTFTLSLVGATASAQTFAQIGAEGGLIPAPVTGLSALTIGPGERADVVVDFGLEPAGTEIVLTNSAPAPFPGNPGEGVVPDVMKFVVQSQAGHTAALPATLRSMEILDPNDAIVSRDFVLEKGPADACSPFVWLINGLGWDDITEYPELGTTEIWRFINKSGMTHPMHLHLIMSQVLDRQSFIEDPNGEIIPVGIPTSPEPEEAGWKDTVQVGPNELVRVIQRFEGFAGKFPYHCHILEHEDHEMMRQFWTISCGNDALEPTEECDDGNLGAVDGCSAVCENEDLLSLYGQANGGSVDLIIDDPALGSPVALSVPTTPGQTQVQAVEAIAAAINADPSLIAAGISAAVMGNTVATNGTFTSVVVNDTGLSDTLAIPALPWIPLVGLLLAITTLAGVEMRRRARARAWTED